MSRARRLQVLAALWCIAAAASPAVGQADTVVHGSNPATRLEVRASSNPVSASLPGKPAYLAYDISFANQDSRELTHVTLTDRLPAGSALVTASSSRGPCSSAAGVVTCPAGKLGAGETVTALVVVQTPASGTTLANTVTATLAERSNDGATRDPKQDTVVATEHTTVASSGASASYVPANTGVELTTDATGRNVTGSGDPLVAGVTVPARTTPLTASLLETAGPFTCPVGSICRSGGWVRATVPGSFFPPLRFFLRWDRLLVDKRQTVKNLQVFHRPSLDSGELETISRRCSSATPVALELPCLWAVTREKDGDFHAVLITDHNGYMR